ncbi:leucyl aminopeptidase family protein [Cryomorpha ignava]|uniref:Leucyl aminopeptidase family protein n=1 Tax=Cryomorpha ignava TaxID=101383 RepID=A0A7K3WLV2_9FLAO|nr:leucyl aminopeptidase family protein [Cryomorpha ignava]NEN22627.1 leucyl aminopeptidase family protein [Cryomorpha ignava]
MMKIEIYSNKIESTFCIKPFFKNSTEKASEIAQKLDAGEWIITDNDIHFCISPEWNLNEIAHHFRLLSVKTKKFWGKTPCLDIPLQGSKLRAALRGILMSSYNPNAQNNKPAEKLKLYVKSIPEIDNTVKQAQAEAETQMWAMKMVDLPPNKKTPEDLGDFARESAKKYGYDCEVWNDDHIIKARLHALHAVGKGSQNPPVFIISKYVGRADSKEFDLAFVGKGITFDTGGISIKGSANMHYMKSDMAGAAAMLGAIELAARLKLPLNIATVVPSAENSVDAKSVLPGDVIESYSGKTIEIIDTDAEGRLVLSDGLAWTVKNLKPAVIIDMATLTGSSVRALGMEAAALYSDNEKLVAALYESGLTSGEKLWRMPLWADYDSYLHSDVADVSNLSLKPVAGSIAAAKFLQVFTNKHTAWAHIDMPGMSFKDSPFFKTKSATGYGVQLLSEFMHRLAENTDLSKE